MTSHSNNKVIEKYYLDPKTRSAIAIGGMKIRVFGENSEYIPINSDFFSFLPTPDLNAGSQFKDLINLKILNNVLLYLR
jgi:hypothetical protein